MSNQVPGTLDLLREYLPFVLPTTTINGWRNMWEVLERKKTPILGLADKVCHIMRVEKDDDALLLGHGFITMYQKGYLFSWRLVDPENVELFDLYYIQQISKERIMERFHIEDERTLYKKLKRSRELFAIALYHFCLFANQ